MNDLLEIFRELNKIYDDLNEDYSDNYQEFLDSIKSPKQLYNWMQENVSYELENEDNDNEYLPDSKVMTKSGEEVWRTKKGHCGEQSNLEWDVLNNLGYEVHLIYCKENNSIEDYGDQGSAHVFVIYNDGKNWYYFENAMEHAKGIHRINSLEDGLDYVGDIWWRCNYNDDTDNFADILEFRELDKPIYGMNNTNLAKECYKYPLIYIYNISDNDFEPEE